MAAWAKPRIVCSDGVSLSVQASEYHFCQPRNNSGPYTHKEVGFIEAADGSPLTPPEAWRGFADDGDFPSDVYGYVPVELIEAFIAEHGGVKKAGA